MGRDAGPAQADAGRGAGSPALKHGGAWRAASAGDTPGQPAIKGLLPPGPKLGASRPSWNSPRCGESHTRHQSGARDAQDQWQATDAPLRDGGRQAETPRPVPVWGREDG